MQEQVEHNKELVRQFINDVMNAGRLDLIDTFYSPELASGARRWIEPFRESFPDMHMEIVDLIAEGDKVVGRFRCSGTHLGTWLGHPPTGKRFTRVDEVGIFRIEDGRIVQAWSLEDTLRRLKQLGLPRKIERSGDDQERGEVHQRQARRITGER